MAPAGGPAQLVLTAAVARRYYVEDASKVEIAEEYGSAASRWPGCSTGPGPAAW
jgi:hypothetical protein